MIHAQLIELHSQKNQAAEGITGHFSAHGYADVCVMSLIHDLHREGAPIQARALAQVVQQRLGVMVHPRSIERALARKKKR